MHSAQKKICSTKCSTTTNHLYALAQLLGSLLDLLVPSIELVLELLRDLLEQLRREDPQQAPRDVQGGEDVAVLVGALSQELLLELVREFKVRVFICAQRFLTDNRLHGARVLSDGVICIQ